MKRLLSLMLALCLLAGCTSEPSSVPEEQLLQPELQPPGQGIGEQLRKRTGVQYSPEQPCPFPARCDAGLVAAGAFQ